MVRRRFRSCRTDSTSVRCDAARARGRASGCVFDTPASAARRARDRCRRARRARARARPTRAWRRDPCRGAATAECRTAPAPCRELRRRRTAARGCRRAAAGARPSAAALAFAEQRRAALRGACEHRLRSIDADDGHAGAGERQRDPAGAAAELEHRPLAPGARSAARTARRAAERPRVLPVVERRVLVPAVPALTLCHGEIIALLSGAEVRGSGGARCGAHVRGAYVRGMCFAVVTIVVSGFSRTSWTRGADGRRTAG